MRKLSVYLFTFLLLAGCSVITKPNPISVHQPTKRVTATQTTEIPTEIEELKLYQNSKPKEWGENITGVIQKMPTEEKVIALTFDACGGEHGSGYDKAIVDYLVSQQIPATLFLNARWIKTNPKIFATLAKNPLFEIENHGTEHRPLSVTGRSIYGIEGTKNISHVYKEIIENAQNIKQKTGKMPKFFRSGTAYYDDVAVKIANDLKVTPVNFDIIGDAGATFDASQVEQALLQAKAGSIVILHMNQPTGETAEGIKKAIPPLLQEGYRFVKLESYVKS